MNVRSFWAGILLLGILALTNSCTEKVPEISFRVNETEKNVEVLIGERMFTAYIYPPSIKKPVLWPVVTVGGNVVTRGFPLDPRAGERVDHPHHVGIWMNYGNVNGYDFWNNSDAIPVENRGGYGTIYQQSIEKAEGGKGRGTLVVTANWTAPTDTVLLTEKTTMVFSASKNVRVIDRKTELTACVDTVKFTDNKEGLFAIRVARQLEIPSDKPAEMTDAHGVITKVEQMDNTGITGNYHSSEGVDGEKVWGSRARWMKLSGTINNEKISVVMIDHPDNMDYPTFWHARGYGLFAANPLGKAVFTNGAENLNYMLLKGQTAVFRYRLVIASDDLTDEAINTMADEFANMKE
jgi:hypothetical protein